MTPDQLRAFLQEKMGLDTEDLADEDPLFSSELLDSFSMVDLIMFIETEAQIKMNPTDVNLDNLDSISRILNFVSAHVAG